jgi:Cu-Zn family superoxide dismutase
MVTFDASFSGLTPGTHAVHIHEKADCSSPDGTSTGGHWNPTMEKHGKWGDADGYHKGDIGNVVAEDDGTATLSMQTDEWCIGCDDETKNIIGKSIIVHQGVDDFTTQPTGDAGGRVSCGGIIK